MCSDAFFVDETGPVTFCLNIRSITDGRQYFGWVDIICIRMRLILYIILFVFICQKVNTSNLMYFFWFWNKRKRFFGIFFCVYCPNIIQIRLKHHIITSSVLYCTQSFSLSFFILSSPSSIFRVFYSLFFLSFVACLKYLDVCAKNWNSFVSWWSNPNTYILIKKKNRIACMKEPHKK